MTTLVVEDFRDEELPAQVEKCYVHPDTEQMPRYQDSSKHFFPLYCFFNNFLLVADTTADLLSR